DVKFSFERYRGSGRHVLKDRVAAVETPEARRVRFKLKQPWPDFLAYYAEATGAGWIVPKTYVKRVGDEGYKKVPVAAGPYKFVSFIPGLELTLEAFSQYWRIACDPLCMRSPTALDESILRLGLVFGSDATLPRNVR